MELNGGEVGVTEQERGGRHSKKALVKLVEWTAEAKTGTDDRSLHLYTHVVCAVCVCVYNTECTNCLN